MKPDLSVKILSQTLKNPIIAASGTFDFGTYFKQFYNVEQLGGIALKALTAEKREGNDVPRIAETTSGIINSVGLQNPGVDGFLKNIYPYIKNYDTTLIANVAGSTIDEYITVIEKLNETNLPFIELNISCPNVKQGGFLFGADEKEAHKITKAARNATEKKLMVKLTPNVTDISKIALAVEDAGADAVSMVNTFSAMAIDAKKRRPILANRTGGLSGPAIKPIALKMVNQVYNAVKIPIVGMGGILSGEDVVEFMLAGAAAVMIGTANIANPLSGLKIIEEFNDFLTEQKIGTASELTGALL